MKKHFKMISVVCALVSIIFYGTVQAGDSDQSQPSNQRQRPGEQGQRPDRRGNPGQGQQSLTDEQKARVVDILSQYNASSLTAEDAQAINNAFREAGIRQGPGQQEAIEAAGFDPLVISSLDPPPDRGGQGRPRRDSQQGQQSGQAN